MAPTERNPPETPEPLPPGRQDQLQERTKELHCLYTLLELVNNPDLSLPELLQKIVELLPPAWQFPEATCARIRLKNDEFTTINFREALWRMVAPVLVQGQPHGELEVGFLGEGAGEGTRPFLEEEKPLLEAVARVIGRLLERKQADAALRENEERVRSLSQQLLRGQEEERRRISRELHDGIGQNLSAIKVGLDSQVVNKLEGSPETRESARALSRLLGETIEGVRDMAHTLRPSGLEQLGLVKAVIHFCEEFEDKNQIAVDLVTGGIDEGSLDYDTRIAIYRLIQEGLINIKKHSRADRVSIRLVSSFPNLILRIEDNGCGFDVRKRKEAAGPEKRLGLSSMEERVSLLAGAMKIDSQPGCGTRIFIEFPVAGLPLEGHHGG